MAVYCNFLGGKLRQTDKDFQQALSVLSQGRQVIEKLHLFGTLEEAANDTRMAYTLADMGRWEETLPLMRRVMDNLTARGYAKDSPTMASTMAAYHYFLGKCGEYTKVKKELADRIRQSIENHEYSSEIIRSYMNYLSLLSENREFEEAREIAGKLLLYCRNQPVVAPVDFAHALLNCGIALTGTGECAEALGLLAEAESVFENICEPGNLSSLRCRYYKVLCLRELKHEA